MSQAPSETLDTFYNQISKLTKQCQFDPLEEKLRLIDAIIYGTSIVKAQEKLLQTPKSLTLDQCLNICRHYERLKLHLDTIKPKLIEYLQKHHNKSRKQGQGHGCGRGKSQQFQQSVESESDDRKPGKWKCYWCGSESKHKISSCPGHKHVCSKCGLKGHLDQVCRKSSFNAANPCCRQKHKSVQEMQSNDLQNTGKLQNNMDMVDMIRSLILHEQRESKKDHQLCQHLNLQEVNYGCPCKISPVLHALVVPTTVNIVWEECHDITECENLLQQYQWYLKL